MYGLDSYVLSPPYSLVVSILLMLSCDMLGLFLIRITSLDLYMGSWVRYQAPLMGLMILAILIYPMVLIGITSSIYLKIISVVLILMFIIIFLVKLKKYHIGYTFLYFRWGIKSLLHNHTAQDYLIYIALLGYFLFSLSPITNADSLNYHAGIALEVLRYGSVPVTPEWFNGRLFGNEEILNAIGLSLGAEQFGSLIQFVSLLSIYSVIRYSNVTNKNDKVLGCLNHWRKILSIIIVSSPLLVGLVGSYKPQLMPIAMTTLALALTTTIISNNFERKKILTVFIIVTSLVMVASQAKFTYLLGGGVVGLVAVGAVYWYGLLRYALLISITLFLIIIMPSVIWKMNSYGGGMMESLLTPLPGGWPGTDNFENMLRNYKDNTVIWPLSLLVPGSIGFVSTIIGISALGFFLIVPDKDISLRIIFISAIFVFFVSAIVGPSSSRSYLEPIIWVTVGLANQNPTILFKLFDKRYALTPILLQYIFTITMLYYGVVNSISGAFSKSARTEIMETLADGYELMRWVDQVLPTNAVLLSYHMSTALVPRKNMSLRWIIYTNDNKLVYLDLIKEKKVTHLLVMADDYRDSVHYSMFSNCIGHIMYGPKIFFQATRNPFNRGDEQNAWLFDIDSEKLPGCISARL